HFGPDKGCWLRKIVDASIVHRKALRNVGKCNFQLHILESEVRWASFAMRPYPACGSRALAIIFDVCVSGCLAMVARLWDSYAQLRSAGEFMEMSLSFHCNGDDRYIL